MRTLACLLLSCSFVIAGDASPLEHAVQKFKSRNPQERDAAQRMVDAELKRMLAPLLKAMRDSDPEVRRRARESLLALIPNPPVQEEPQPVALINVAQANVQRQVALALLGRMGKLNLRNEAARQLRLQTDKKAKQILAQLLLERDADKKAKQFLASFGLTGAPRFGLRTNPGGERVAGFIVYRATKTAALVGLKRGDLIVKVNGLKIVNADNMRIAFGDKPQSAKVEVLRAGKLVTLTTQPAAKR